jgi:hypothetical protein
MAFRHLRNVRGFFSDYYLGSVLGRGAGRGARKIASDRGTDQAYDRFRRIRERAEGRADDAPTCRERFIRPLLRDVLGFHLGAGENGIHGLFRVRRSGRAWASGLCSSPTAGPGTKTWTLAGGGPIRCAPWARRWLGRGSPTAF